jgi:hypothetical protein
MSGIGLDIVSALRKMSTKPDQVHSHETAPPARDACEAFFELTLRAGRIALRTDMAPPR